MISHKSRPMPTKCLMPTSGESNDFIAMATPEEGKMPIKCLTPGGLLLVILLMAQSLLWAQEENLSTHKDSTQAEQREQAIKKALFVASAAKPRILKIGLVDCIAFALKNNSEIKIERIEPLLSREDTRIAESDFEPTIDIDISSEETKEQSSSVYALRATSTRSDKFNAGVEGKLPPGTEYSLDFDNEKSKSTSTYRRDNPYYESEATLTITQPLFKDFGILVNRADIIIANNDLLKSNQELKEELIEVISKVKNYYYDYILYIEKYATVQVSLKRAKDLLNIIQKRQKQGLASSIDLLEVQTGVAEREDALLAIEKSLKFAEDNLKYITNIVDDPQLWNANIEPLDKPELKAESVDLARSLMQAFENRPDYEAARIELKSQNIRIEVKKNALLPTIDLEASLGLNGLNKDYDEALSDMVSGDYRDWGVGATVSFPWGNKEAKGDFEKAKLTKAQLLISFDRLQQTIILEVRDAVRGVEIAEQKIETARKRKDTENKRYEAIEKRFKEGLVSTHDMLEYQEDLSGAEENYIQSLIDYSESLITLDKRMGITLVKHDIKLEE